MDMVQQLKGTGSNSSEFSDRICSRRRGNSRLTARRHAKESVFELYHAVPEDSLGSPRFPPSRGPSSDRWYVHISRRRSECFSNTALYENSGWMQPRT